MSLGSAFSFVSMVNEIFSFIIHSVWLLLHRKTIDFSKLFVLNHQTEYCYWQQLFLDNSLLCMYVLYVNIYIIYINISINSDGLLPPPSFYTFYVSFLSISLLSYLITPITQLLIISSIVLFHWFISILFLHCYAVKGLHFIFNVRAVLCASFLKH